MRSTILRTLVASGVILVLTLLFVAAIHVYKAFVPESVDMDTINISRSDYDQAYSRWSSSHAKEYEYTIVLSAVQITLHVNRETNEVKMVGLKEDGHDVSPDDFEWQRVKVSSELLGVDQMFDWVDERLQPIASGTLMTLGHKDVDKYHDVLVQFDPKLGFPTELIEFLRTTRASREIAWRETLEFAHIKDLNVIR